MIQISKSVENDNINYLLKMIDSTNEIKSMTNLYLKCYLVEKSFRTIQYLNMQIDFFRRDPKNQNRKLMILQILTNFFLKLNKIHFMADKQTTGNETLKTNVINWIIELMDNLKSESQQDQVKTINFFCGSNRT